MIVLILINKSSLNLKNKGKAITYIKDDFSSASQVLLGPTFIGLDKEKKPFKVSAAKATKLNNSTEVFDLEEKLSKYVEVLWGHIHEIHV